MTSSHSSPAPEYVRKVRVSVRILLPGQDPVEGFVSLDPSAERHQGPQTLLERLNRGDRVLPVLRGGERDVLLVNPLDVEVVEALANVPAELVVPPTYLVTHEERVRVRFMSGRMVEGTLRFELPNELNRVSDFMNADDDFFSLAGPHGILLVNKRRVSTTRLYEESPRPGQAREEREAA